MVLSLATVVNGLTLCFNIDRVNDKSPEDMRSEAPARESITPSKDSRPCLVAADVETELSKLCRTALGQ